MIRNVNMRAVKNTIYVIAIPNVIVLSLNSDSPTSRFILNIKYLLIRLPENAITNLGQKMLWFKCCLKDEIMSLQSTTMLPTKRNYVMWEDKWKRRTSMSLFKCFWTEKHLKSSENEWMKEWMKQICGSPNVMTSQKSISHWRNLKQMSCLFLCMEFIVLYIVVQRSFIYY